MIKINLTQSIRCWPLESSGAFESDPDIRDRLRAAGISLQGLELAYNVRVWCIQRILELSWEALETTSGEDDYAFVLAKIAELWLYGLRPAKEELNQIGTTIQLLELTALKQIIDWISSLSMIQSVPDKKVMKTAAHLKTTLTELGIPARFEP